MPMEDVDAARILDALGEHDMRYLVSKEDNDRHTFQSESSRTQMTSWDPRDRPLAWPRA